MDETPKFKVGDTAYVVTRGYNGKGGKPIESVKTVKIKTITEKRGIVKLIDCTTEFKLDGRPAKYQGYSSYDVKLELWTVSLMREIRVAKIVRAARAMTFDAVNSMSQAVTFR